MTTALWTWDALVAAAQGVADGAPSAAITGFSIDTRSIAAGEVFVALTDTRDGHDFVTAAFKAGAAAALVRREYARRDGDGPLIWVDDPLRALGRVGVAARGRLSRDARVIAVTGSAGKTGTKEMLRAVLSPLGKTHAPEKSFNNHWGVPLTLARMPADTQYAVIEIGMNHAGEITPLTKMTRPHIAIITNVLPVHVGNFPDGEIGVANAKAEIFAGLEPGGVAILPCDNAHFETLARAVPKTAEGILFGEDSLASAWATSIITETDGTTVTVEAAPLDRPTERGLRYTYRVGMPGRHIALNSLAVVATLQAIGRLSSASLQPLAAIISPAGRGARATITLADGGAILFIDESYNANPASMRAALANLALVPRDAHPRRIAVMGDMRELGVEADALHRGLHDAVVGSGVDHVFACGPDMRQLFDTLPAGLQAGWTATSTELAASVKAALRAGDVVMVKGSLGTNMAPIVSAIRSLDVRARTDTA